MTDQNGEHALPNPDLSRRKLFKTLAFLTAKTLTPNLNLNTPPQTPNKEVLSPTSYPIPPSLMLHSDHGTNVGEPNGLLPVLARELNSRNYSALTYKQWLEKIIAGDPVPEKPVIISIDDLTMTTDQHNPTYSTFKNMAVFLQEQNIPFVFAINTWPNKPQDDDKWQEVASWAESGNIELATHSAQHTNFNQSNGTPRNDLTQEMINAEIVESAQIIHQKTNCPVKTFITPFGSGYNRSQQQIHPNIVKACQSAEINFVVGIPDGRIPIERQAITDNPQSVFYVGRVGPGTPGNINAMSAINELGYWMQQYYHQQ